MTGSAPDGLPGGWEAAAAEYVLGLMPEDERRSFEARLSQDRDLRQDVAAWQLHFSTLVDTVPERAPPPQLLNRIEARIFRRTRPGLWRQLWPYLAGAVAAAAIGWAVLESRLIEGAPTAIQEAALTPMAATGPAGTVTLDPASGTLRIDLSQGRGGTGTLMLWLIDDGGRSPVALGPVAGEGPTTLTLPPELGRLLATRRLALSDATRNGAPPGPVLASGRFGPG